MSTQFRTIAIVCMVLVLISAPCVVACPYSVTGNSTSSSTDDGSCSSCGETSSTDSIYSTCSNASYSPYTYGVFKCVNGLCAAGYCVDGNCDTTKVNDSSAGNASGAIMCKDGTCEAKVCNGNETCKTGSFSTSGDEDTITAWFSQIFGDNSNSNATPEETNNYEIENQEVSTPKAVNEETTSQSNGGYTYTVAGPTTPKKSSTNYFGTLAMSGNTESNETPADTTKPDVSTCENGSCATPTETSPTIVTSSSKESSTCTAYDTVYAALRADKTEKKIFSDSYTSLNFAQDVSTAMKAAGVGCDTVKVTFTDGSVNYLNSMKTCNGELLVDSCGTSLGTGIKKQVTVLEVGQQWTAKSLFGECTKTYTRGIVSSIE